MANVQAMCTSFKKELFNGLHAFGTSVVRAATTPDSFKAALFFASATKDATTTAYNTTGEATGTGYVAGGVAVSFGTAPNTSGTTAFVTPSASIVFPGITVVTNVDAIQIYNDTSAGKLSVSIHTFAAQTVAGSLTLNMPTNDATTGLLRLL